MRLVIEAGVADERIDGRIARATVRSNRLRS